MFADILRHRAEIRRALNNHQYEHTAGGILLPRMGAQINGVFEHFLNGGDHRVDPNILPTEGLNNVLDVVLHGGSQTATWYIGLFEGNVTPDATYTAANVTSNSTEFTSYDEAARVAFVEAAASAGSTTNSGNEADFTISTGVADKDLYGAFLASASAKSAITGKLLSIALFSSARRVNATDVLSIRYTLTLTSS